MGRKPLPPDERKENITFRLEKRLIDKLKLIKGYNLVVEDFIRKLIKNS